jgi:hypothetical protein
MSVSSASQIEFTHADVAALAERLRALAATLSPGERAALADLLERAESATDVQGFALGLGVFHPAASLFLTDPPGGQPEQKGQKGNDGVTTSGPTEMVVLSDQAGNYYLFAREAIEQARVPSDQKAEIDEQLKGGDVSGFAFLSPSVVSQPTPVFNPVGVILWSPVRLPGPTPDPAPWRAAD